MCELLLHSISRAIEAVIALGMLALGILLPLEAGDPRRLFLLVVPIAYLSASLVRMVLVRLRRGQNG